MQRVVLWVRAIERMDGERVSEGGCFLSPPNGPAWLSPIMRAQQYKSAKGLHPQIIVKWHVTYKKKNAACSHHVHGVSRKKTEQQNSGIAINSLSALFPLILDSLLGASVALLSLFARPPRVLIKKVSTIFSLSVMLSIRVCVLLSPLLFLTKLSMSTVGSVVPHPPSKHGGENYKVPDRPRPSPHPFC